MQIAELETARRRVLGGVASRLLRLKWHAAATRFELALRRHDRALKYSFNPDEPRVPAGVPEGGQWTSGGGSTGRMRLAGDVPTGDLPPEIPREKPPTSEGRTALLKQVARHIAEFGTTVEMFARLNPWLLTRAAEIRSYNDLPKSLEELQRAVSPKSEPGYQDHHIVEQGQARDDGYPREVINSRENVVRIPKLKHEEINGWYSRKNPRYGGQSPRQYLSGRNWEVRRAVGLEALRDRGVLKP